VRRSAAIDIARQQQAANAPHRLPPHWNVPPNQLGELIDAMLATLTGKDVTATLASLAGTDILRTVLIMAGYQDTAHMARPASAAARQTSWS
jgi:hypothetical protein